ncbi:MAG: hypothetical protein LBV17_08755 [Treponema sp.]|jgi:hypothetical protein|nr:hypothetical protein [Treponema sp.]
MNLTGKAAGLALLFFFALVLVSPVLAEEQTPIDEQPAVEPAAGPATGDEVPLVQETSPIEESVVTGPAIEYDDSFDDDAFFFEAPTLVFEAVPIEPRSFNDIFPDFSRSQIIRAMNETGLRYAFEKGGSPALIPNPDSGIDLLSGVMAKKPSHVIEALVVVPYKKRELDMLDVYNALGRVKNIKDHKAYINGREIVIFKDTTRLVSAKNRKPIPDPSPTNTLPYSETMYLLFLDPYLGDLYLRGDVSISLYGLTYSMTNFRDVSYSIFKVMKAERFTAVIYAEPIKEGILIYSVSGLYLPNFIAKRVNLTPNMNRRITVLLNWITEGLRIEEERRQDKHFYRLKPK